ncbi:BsuPI-related putative proteinase inhibitor [Alkalihalobacillus sp. FSL W8-0930]
MYKMLTSILVLGFLFALTACGQETEAPDENESNQQGVEEMNGWQLEVQAVQDSEQLRVNMLLTNKTDEVQTLIYPSSQTYELVLTDESEEEVYRFSEGMMFTMALIEEEIETGGTQKFQESISVADLEEGHYTLSAEIVGKPQNEVELPVTTIDVDITKS